MRWLRFLAPVLALALGACNTSGPGVECDPCAVAEANPAAGGSSAAAAAASGGQRANNAPLAEDTARLAPVTAVGRGAGDTSNSSSNTERREVASGGAQNIALMNPTSAEANVLGGGGGVPGSVQEARLTVAQWRGQLALVLTSEPYDPSKAEFVRTNLMAAQAALNEAEAAWTASRPSLTVNHNMGGDNTLIGVSTSKTGEANAAVDPEVAQAMAEAAAKARAEVTKRRAAEAAAKAGDTGPAAALAAPEASSAPPAGAAPDPFPAPSK